MTDDVRQILTTMADPPGLPPGDQTTEHVLLSAPEQQVRDVAVRLILMAREALHILSVRTDPPPPPWLVEANVRLREQVEELSTKANAFDLMTEADPEDERALWKRQGELLTGVADGLKGPPPPLVSWDWSDLPERAEQMRAALDAAVDAHRVAFHDGHTCPFPTDAQCFTEIRHALDHPGD